MLSMVESQLVVGDVVSGVPGFRLVVGVIGSSFGTMATGESRMVLMTTAISLGCALEGAGAVVEAGAGAGVGAGSEVVVGPGQGPGAGPGVEAGPGVRAGPGARARPRVESGPGPGVRAGAFEGGSPISVEADGARSEEVEAGAPTSDVISAEGIAMAGISIG